MRLLAKRVAGAVMLLFVFTAFGSPLIYSVYPKAYFTFEGATISLTIGVFASLLIILASLSISSLKPSIAFIFSIVDLFFDA